MKNRNSPVYFYNGSIMLCLSVNSLEIRAYNKPMCFIEGYKARKAQVEEKREGKWERGKTNSGSMLLSLPHLSNRTEQNKAKHKNQNPNWLLDHTECP